MDFVPLALFWTTLALAAYTYVGYFALLLLVPQRTSRTSTAGRTTLPKVTLIIPAHNEAAVLEDKLVNSLAIGYPRERLEILVASDGSRDDTVRIAERYARQGVKLLAFPNRRGKAAVLSDAAAAAGGEVLCFCDANVLFHRDALSILVARLADPRVGAVTGEVRLASEDSNYGQGESAYYQLERRIQRGESALGSLMGVDGGMYCVKRSLFQPLPVDTILDDFAISMQVIRQGFRVVYEPLARADENGTPTATQEFRRRVRLAAGAIQCLKRGHFPPLSRPIESFQFLSHKLLRWLGPWILLVCLISHLILAAREPLYAGLLAIHLTIYGLAAAGAASLAFRATRIGGIPFYFLMSQVALAIGTFKGLFDLQPVTWTSAARGPVVPPAKGVQVVS